MAEAVPAKRAPAGNTATIALKLIALFFMIIDHSGKMVFNNMAEMRILGRIAFPIYAWCVIVGFHYTRSVPRYLLRMLVTGVVSQPLYFIVMRVREAWPPQAAPALLHDIVRSFSSSPNIFLTLFLGLCALWGIRERKWLSQFWAPAAALVLGTVMNADYGWKGVLLFILLYAVRDSRPGIAAVMFAYFMYWGTGYSLTQSLFGIELNVMSLPEFLRSPISSLLHMETYALLSLPFLLIRFPKDLKLPRWICYALYPGHLLIVWAMKFLLL